MLATHKLTRKSLTSGMFSPQPSQGYGSVIAVILFAKVT